MDWQWQWQGGGYGGHYDQGWGTDKWGDHASGGQSYLRLPASCPWSAHRWHEQGWRTDNWGDQASSGQSYLRLPASCLQAPRQPSSKSQQGACLSALGDGGGARKSIEDMEEYERDMRNAVGDFIVGKAVYILVVKGNYKHRLLKLGVELSPDELTDDQMELRDILKKCGLFDGKEKQRGRPDWSNGACVYLTAEDAVAINWKDAVQREQVLGVTLQSKHIICSLCYYELLERVLHDQSAYANQTGREAFLIRRAGVLSERIVRPLPDAAVQPQELYQ